MSSTERVERTDDLGSRAYRSIGWVIVEKWGVRIISLIVFAILTRLLNASDFGLLSLAAVFIAVLSVFVDSGFSKALVQRNVLAPKDAVTAFWTSLVIALTIYGALALLAPAISTLLGEPRLALILCVLGATLPITALASTPAALLERELQFKSLSLRNLAGTLTGALVAIPLALFGAGVWALVAQPLVTAVAAAAVLWTASPWRPTWQFSRESLRNLYGLGAGVLGIGLLNAIQANIDKLIIGAFFGPTAVGFYFVGQKALNTLSELVTTVISRVSLTTFSRVQDDSPRLNRILQRMTFASSSVAVPVFGITALLAPQVLPFVFGSTWAPAVPIFQLLSISAAFTSITYFDQNVLLATGKAKPAFLLALGQNILGIFLIFAAVPFGVIGVAASRSVRVIAYWPIRLATLRRSAGVVLRPYLKQLLITLLAIIPAGILIIGLQQTTWAESDSVFLTFALPLGFLSLIMYGATNWLLMGTTNRRVVLELKDAVVARLRRKGRGRGI